MKSIIYVGPGDISAEEFRLAMDQAVKQDANIHILSHTTISWVGPFTLIDKPCKQWDGMMIRNQQPFWTKNWRRP